MTATSLGSATAERSAKSWQVGAVAVGLALAVVVASSAAVAPAARSAGYVEGVGCAPQILYLPRTTDTESSRARAISDEGWIVGSLIEQDEPSRAVVWRNGRPPLELGVGGVRRSDGTQVLGQGVDVNERGVVAIQRDHVRSRLRWGRSAAFLWDDGHLSRLKGTRRQPAASIEAVNDRGVAVGWIQGPGTRTRAAVWRDGTPLPLPRPPGTRAFAADINNHGLVVGWIDPPGAYNYYRPWWWRIGGGNGPLPANVDGERREGYAVSVDDSGRIVGELNQPPFVWRNRWTNPGQLFGANNSVASLHNSGYLTGSGGGFRGYDDRAWVARLADSRPTTLPAPPLDDPTWWLANTFAADLARGTTAYAPHGGVTVAGVAVIEADAGMTRALLWTCAQTYRR